MGKQIALNTLYTLVIVICVWLIYSGIVKERYEWSLGAFFIGALMVTLKVRLLKQVRNQHRK